MLVPFPAQAGR